MSGCLSVFRGQQDIPGIVVENHTGEEVNYSVTITTLGGREILTDNRILAPSGSHTYENVDTDSRLNYTISTESGLENSLETSATEGVEFIIDGEAIEITVVTY
ncbi:hypothetical protein [Haloarchaeobius baliensis]|uniref:hypothetical protein n=1 Tax=Haloarchaeobius baliensis TaxID=1670458 RepID=UPI003F882980